MSGNAITNFYTLQDKRIMGISEDAASGKHEHNIKLSCAKVQEKLLCTP